MDNPVSGFCAYEHLFMGAMLYILNVRKFLVIVCFSVVSSAVLYLAFKVVLMVPLPGGILGFSVRRHLRWTTPPLLKVLLLY